MFVRFADAFVCQIFDAHKSRSLQSILIVDLKRLRLPFKVKWSIATAPVTRVSLDRAMSSG